MSYKIPCNLQEKSEDTEINVEQATTDIQKYCVILYKVGYLLLSIWFIEHSFYFVGMHEFREDMKIADISLSALCWIVYPLHSHFMIKYHFYKYNHLIAYFNIFVGCFNIIFCGYFFIFMYINYSSKYSESILGAVMLNFVALGIIISCIIIFKMFVTEYKCIKVLKFLQSQLNLIPNMNLNVHVKDESVVSNVIIQDRKTEKQKQADIVSLEIYSVKYWQHNKLFVHVQAFGIVVYFIFAFIVGIIIY